MKLPMHDPDFRLSRRAFVGSALAAGAALPLSRMAEAAPGARLTREIPSSREALSVIGMGTWITFNVGRVPALLAARTEVLRAFFAAGGGMIDRRGDEPRGGFVGDDGNLAVCRHGWRLF